MATETQSTKDQVRELMDQNKSAEEIAEALSKTKATVYVHIRNINAERGIKPRGRGRPPKVEGSESKSSTRKAPPRAAPKSSSKTEGKKGPGRPPKQTPAPVAGRASTNGHTTAEEFPKVKAAIEAELVDARRRVTKLEGMLAAFES